MMIPSDPSILLPARMASLELILLFTGNYAFSLGALP